MKTMKTAVFLLALGALAGCKSHHDKAWYKSHDTERAAQVKACQNDAAIRVTPDCENAIDADQEKRAFGDTSDIKTPDFGLKH